MPTGPCSCATSSKATPTIWSSRRCPGRCVNSLGKTRKRFERSCTATRTVSLHGSSAKCETSWRLAASTPGRRRDAAARPLHGRTVNGGKRSSIARNYYNASALIARACPLLANSSGPFFQILRNQHTSDATCRMHLDTGGMHVQARFRSTRSRMTYRRDRAPNKNAADGPPKLS